MGSLSKIATAQRLVDKRRRLLREAERDLSCLRWENPEEARMHLRAYRESSSGVADEDKQECALTTRDCQDCPAALRLRCANPG